MFKTIVKTMFLIMFETVFKTVFKTVSKTMSEIMFETMIKNKIKNDEQFQLKNMSFLKITDSKKRDYIVNEFHKTRQNIEQNFLSERVGDMNTQYELSKLLKPVTDIQKI